MVVVVAGTALPQTWLIHARWRQAGWWDVLRVGCPPLHLAILSPLGRWCVIWLHRGRDTCIVPVNKNGAIKYLEVYSIASSCSCCIGQTSSCDSWTSAYYSSIVWIFKIFYLGFLSCYRICAFNADTYIVFSLYINWLSMWNLNHGWSVFLIPLILAIF